MPGPAAFPKATLLLAAVVAAGCRPQPAAELADLVDLQRHRVGTDVVSVADGTGLESLGFGWHLSGEEGSPGRAAEPAGRWAALDFFAPDADVAGVIVEGAVSEGEVRPRLVARLNGERIGRRALEPGRQRLRFDFPPDLVEAGDNRLELLLAPEGARAAGRRPARLQVRRFLFPTRSGRPPRAGDRHELRVVEVEGWLGRRRQILMPTPSTFEATLRLPAGARLAGHIAFEPPPGPGARGRFRLRMDDGEETRTLVELEPGGAFGDPVDLAPWGGRLVTLGFELTGEADVMARLTDLRVEPGGEGAPEPAIAARPAAPEPAAASGRLGRPDVVLILLDAARADVFSAYGSPWPTPGVDRLAAEGTLFERARSPSAWTGQSVPAMLTGYAPDSLGIEHWASRLPPSVPTLAERASAAGYDTVLWSQHPLYKPRQDLMRGFRHVHFGDQERRDLMPSADELVPGERPVLALVHLLPPHTPYEPPPAWRGRVAQAATPSLDVGAPFLNSFPLRRDPTQLEPGELDYVRHRYVENALFADSLVQRIVERLEARGRYEGALVAVFSDHGEAFLEHGFFLHGRHLWGEYVDVPWVVKWPAGAGAHAARVAAPVSLVDLTPTLIDGLGLDGTAAVQGRSLLPAVFDGEPVARPVYTYTRGVAHAGRPPRPKAAIETRRFKLIRFLDEREIRLYDRLEDPGEQRDLAAERPLLARWLDQSLAMQRALNRRLQDTLAAGVEPSELDDETIEKLRALGYLQ